MATHSSILTWETPQTKDPGRLQSMGSRESDTTERLSHQYQPPPASGVAWTASRAHNSGEPNSFRKPPALRSLLWRHCPLLSTFILQTSTEMLLEASLTLGAGSNQSLAF